MFSKYNIEPVKKSSPTAVTRSLKPVKCDTSAKTEVDIQTKVSSNTRYSYRPNMIEVIK